MAFRRRICCKFRLFASFPVFHELNALPQDKHESYHADNRAQAAADQRLDQMMTVLLDLHAHFFAHYDATHKIKPIGLFLRDKRRGVLRGTRIMFSSVYGREDRSMKAVILQMAVQHGADCATELDDVVDGEVELPPDVTHVVARFDATSKARAAVKTEGVYLVTVEWFMESIARLQRLPETDFPVGKRAVIFGQPRKPFTEVSAGSNDVTNDNDAAAAADDDSSSDSDDDDDDDDGDDNADDDDDDDGGVRENSNNVSAMAAATSSTTASVVRPSEVLGSGAEDPSGWHDSEDDVDPFGESNGGAARATVAIGTTATPPHKRPRVEPTTATQSELDQLLDQL
jgi:hypothetical protein